MSDHDEWVPLPQVDPGWGSLPEFFQAVYNDSIGSDHSPFDSVFPSQDFPSVEITPYGEVFGSYDDVRGYVHGTELTGHTEEGAGRSDTFVAETHHLLSASMIDPFGIDTGSVPAVVLDWHSAGGDQESHSIMSSDIGQAARYGDFHDIDEVYAAHASVYSQTGHDDWTDRVDTWIADHKDDLMVAYLSGILPGADNDAFAERLERVTAWLDEF